MATVSDGYSPPTLWQDWWDSQAESRLRGQSYTGCGIVWLMPRLRSTDIRVGAKVDAGV